MSKVDIDEEFRGSRLADARLSRRLEALADAISAAPSESFPKLLSEAELEGAYRFFGNERVSVGEILAPHVTATRERMGENACVVAHDTTTLSFRAGGEREGLGRGSKGNQVLHAHVSLAVDGSHNPLGVLALRTHVGSAATLEHERWVEQALLVDKQFESRQTIHVMDREADDYKLLSELSKGGHRFVVRSQTDRLLSWNKGRMRLSDLLEGRPTLTREVELSKRVDTGRGGRTREIHPAREQRLATLSFASARAVILRTRRAPVNTSEAIDLGVVKVWEVNPPNGEAPVEWYLTSEPVDAPEEVLRVVDYYRRRWVIEEYFKAIKTGCAIEKRQLESRHALENALGIFMPIAWALMSLRNALRTTPDAPASKLVPPTELAVLRALARKPLPKAPTVRDAVLAIAALGGHLKRNGDPGWLTLSRGYEELTKTLFGFRLARGLLFVINPELAAPVAEPPKGDAFAVRRAFRASPGRLRGPWGRPCALRCPIRGSLGVFSRR